MPRLSTPTSPRNWLAFPVGWQQKGRPHLGERGRHSVSSMEIRQQSDESGSILVVELITRPIHEIGTFDRSRSRCTSEGIQ